MIEKLYKITHFEILTLKTFSQKFIKQTLHSDVLLPDFEFWLRQPYEMIFFTKPVILFWIQLFFRL